MVINFNLLLVWLPMCKYSLTKMASLATLNSMKQRRRQQQQQQQQNQLQLKQVVEADSERRDSRWLLLLAKSKCFLQLASQRLDRCFFTAKTLSINSFLNTVDHCTSLHTICATTITIASGKSTLAGMNSNGFASCQTASTWRLTFPICISRSLTLFPISHPCQSSTRSLTWQMW